MQARAAAPSTRAAPAPPAAPLRPPLRLLDLMGRAPGEIDLRLGVPGLVRTEGKGQVRIYSNPDCILHIFAYPGGAASRVTHVEARTQTSRLAGDAFNVGLGERRSLLDLLKTLSEVAGVDLAPEFRAPRAGDVPHSCAAIDRAREDLGYAPEVAFEEGLRRTFEWAQSVASRT